MQAGHWNEASGAEGVVLGADPADRGGRADVRGDLAVQELKAMMHEC